MAQNLALALDLAKTFRFLLLQVNKYLPENVKYPEVTFHLL